jgi:GH18 family chitinase
MVTYDDPESIGIKCDYAIEKGFRGVMIWELSRGYLYWKEKNQQPLLETIGAKFKSLIK